ncbi:MFS transporter [Streptomyces sp. NBC_00670]|uniref:MFS transporter n=1 Tax=Streptomyces sp. NBC_00670 TaxID=2975804 RepID=UPI002E305D72|nr:MFS transporter [Streptomyces sp. NBC_00670]
MTLEEDAGPSSLWRRPRFVSFSAGVFANNLGDGIYAVTLPLLSYDLTGSLHVMALLSAVTPVALLLSGPLLGHLADRYGTRGLVLSGLAVQFLAVLVLIVVLGGDVRPGAWLLVVCELSVQFGGATYRSGWFASLPALFPDQPGQARGVQSASFRVTTVLGPLLAGALLGPLGYVGLLWLNLGTFLVPAAVWLAGVRPPRKTDGGRAHDGFARSVLAGWRVLRGSRVVFTTMVLVAFVEVLGGTGSQALSVFYLRDELRLSGGRVEFVLTVVNLCATAGALWATRIAGEGSRLRIGHVALGALLTTAGSLALMTSGSPVLVTLAMTGLFGSYSVLNVAAEVLLYRMMPAEYIGRLWGLWRLVCGGAEALGPLVISVSSGVLPVRGVFLVLGAIAMLPLCWLLLRIRTGWDTLPPPPAARHATTVPGPADTA